MNTTYLICGAMLMILVSMFKPADGRDGRKWRQRRIAHVFGKRNGDSSDKIFQFPQTGPLPIYSEDSEDSQDYDPSYDTEPDYIPESVLRRLSYLELLRRLRPANSEVLNYWADLKNYLACLMFTSLKLKPPLI